MQKNTEQMKLENDQIEVIVNYHGAELRNTSGMQMRNTGSRRGI